MAKNTDSKRGLTEGAGAGVNSPPGAERLYRSEVNAPSPPISYPQQASPTRRLYPFPITDMPEAPPTGDEQAREVDGDNPPVLAPHVRYSNAGASAADLTAGSPNNRAPATDGGDFLASQGLG